MYVLCIFAGAYTREPAVSLLLKFVESEKDMSLICERGSKVFAIWFLVLLFGPLSRAATSKISAFRVLNGFHAPEALL